MTPPVTSHQDEGVDGDVGRDVDDVLHCPAPGQSEGPELEDVVTGSGGDTHLERIISIHQYPTIQPTRRNKRSATARFNISKLVVFIIRGLKYT